MKKPKGFIGKALGWLIKATSEEAEEIDRELPYAVMVFTIMAASGVSLYEAWKRMRKFDLLPRFKSEAEEVVRQVEVLGKDPLTVMYDRAEETRSKLYRDFLSGFVSSVKSGGKIVDFMKSKLRSIFELRSNAINRSIERLGTLVEAYAVMLIVVLCVYILYVVLSSTALMELLAKRSLPTSPYMAYLVAFFVMPLISLIFMLAAHNIQRSPLLSLRKVYLKSVVPGIAVAGLLCVFAFVPSLSKLAASIGWPCLITLALVIISLPPAVSYYKIAKTNSNAEEALPSFLRDVTEARKIGLSPEKSIIHASKRRDYGAFSKLLELIRSQIEWGVSLRKIFENIKMKIKSWNVLVNLMIMTETIEIGGGPSHAFEILTEYCEKEREVQINKRALLKPYIILSFVWSILIALTTTIVAMTIYILTQLTIPSLSPSMLVSLQRQIEIFSIGIIIQCWISGFFIGKISEGNFAAGFKYSAMLALTAYISLVLSQSFLWGAYGMSAPT